VTLATGDKEGVYHALGLEIESAVEKAHPDLDIMVLETEGSVENAKLIAAGVAQLALVQNDVAYYFYKGERLFPFPCEKMRGVAALYTEVVHIIARRELDIQGVEELVGKEVAIGARQSGTQFNAAIILEASGISKGDIHAQFKSFGEARQSLLDGTIDVAFMTAGVPAGPVTDLGQKINLIRVDPALVRKLQKTYPYFVFTAVPARSYPGQFREVDAVGVRALLVARSDVKNDVVEKIADTILTDPTAWVLAQNVGSEIRLESAQKGMTIPLHRGATDYFVKQKVMQREWTDYARLLLWFVVPMLALLVFVNYRKVLVRAWRRNLYVKLAAIFGFSFIAATITMHCAEKRVNEHFSELGESFWSVIVYLLSGFEDRPPLTVGGRIVSVFIFTVAIALLGSVVGKFASVFISRRERKMPGDIRDHIAICNWNEEGEKIVRQLHASDAEPDTEIAVITALSDAQKEELRNNPVYDKVYFHRGDPVAHSVLKESRTHLAKAVIILPDRESGDPDAKSALIALALRNLCKGAAKPHVVAGVFDQRRMEHLRNAGVDEIICASDLGLGLLAQCALHPGLSDVYQQLLEYSAETNEVYVVEERNYPKSFMESSYEKVAGIVNAHRDTLNPTILIGLLRGGKVMLNPKGCKNDSGEWEAEKIEKGDGLIVIAYEQPNLRRLVP